MSSHSCACRTFFTVLGLGAVLVSLAACTSSAGPLEEKVSGRKPNIVFILADDQGLHQLGCYGNDFYETPHIDRLAREGMRFTEAYAAATVCSPTRGSLMTGKYPARLHLTDFIKGGSPRNRKLLTPEWTAYLPLEELTLAEALRSAGYVCGHFGKWHLNKNKNYKPGRPGDPRSQGFDDVLTTVKPKSSADPYSDPHHTKEITDGAIAFIRTNRERPFFCYVPHNTIHRPQMERPELVAKYKAKPGVDDDKNQAVLAAMVETLDRNVGRVLDTLDELKITDNTIVIYFADNGALGKQDVLKPLRGSKAGLYEGGIKEPLLVRWPGVVEPGSECDVPVISNDFFPTLLEVVGLELSDPTVDGVSLLPLLTQNGKLKRNALYWHYPHYHHQGIAPSGAVRAGNYKLIEWFEKSVDGIGAEGAVELFNLKEDISEQHNLAGEMPEKTALLYEKLKQWRREVGAQEMTRNPGYSRQETAGTRWRKRSLEKRRQYDLAADTDTQQTTQGVVP